MNIEAQFNSIAKEYDCNRKKLFHVLMISMKIQQNLFFQV